MKNVTNFALFALAAVIGCSMATRSIGFRGPAIIRRGDRVEADTNAEALGDITDSFGNSNVETDPYGTRGSVSHGARGVGRFGTAARSSGQITSGNRFGGSSVGSQASADAFGTHSSISETRGGAESYNGRGRSVTSSNAAASGFGNSRASTSAGAGRNRRSTGAYASGSRFKRHCRYGNCGGSTTAGTDAEAFGHHTSSFGNSDVTTDNFGSRGRISHGASGSGVGHSGARSGGKINTNGPFGGSTIGSDATADSFGNLASFAETKGDAQSKNGFGSSGFSSSSSTAGSRGFGHSRSITNARAGGRAKRTATNPLCILGRCYGSVETRSGGNAQGDFTDSFGDSSVLAQPGSLHASATHESRGSGHGRTGAGSRTQINTDTQFGFESFGSAGTADAVGDSSLSWSSSKNELVNGASRSQSQSRGQASGRGRSAAKSEATATTQG